MKTATEEIIAAFGGFYDDPKELENEIARLDRESAFTIRLIRLRVSLGLSQRELAERSGLSTAAVRRMEAGTDAQLDEDEVQAYLRGLGKR